MIVFSAILPHPPLSIPGVGSEESRKSLFATLDAYAGISKELHAAQPETVVVVSPHGKIEPYHFVVNEAPVLVGDFSRYPLPKQIEFQNDLAIVDDILFACDTNELPVHGRYEKLDHGTFIPLWHLFGGSSSSVKVVHISFSFLDVEKHHEFGESVGNMLDRYYAHKRIAVIASADLSHRIAPNSPAGYSPNARYFDRKIIEILEEGDVHRLMELRKDVVAEAAECGLRSIIIVLGILDGYPWKFRLFSYEHPFGIGHLVGRLL